MLGLVKGTRIGNFILVRDGTVTSKIDTSRTMLMRKILVMGLPGAGKTTLTTVLAPLINAVVFNADAVRANLSRDLGFSLDDRVEHARRMGWLCDRVLEAGRPGS